MTWFKRPKKTSDVPAAAVKGVSRKKKDGERAQLNERRNERQGKIGEASQQLRWIERDLEELRVIIHGIPDDNPYRAFKVAWYEGFSFSEFYGDSSNKSLAELDDEFIEIKARIAKKRDELENEAVKALEVLTKRYDETVNLQKSILSKRDNLEVEDLDTFQANVFSLRRAAASFEKVYSILESQDQEISSLSANQIVAEWGEEFDSLVRRPAFREKMRSSLICEAEENLLPKQHQKALILGLRQAAVEGSVLGGDILVYHPHPELTLGEQAFEVVPQSGVYKIPLLAIRLKRWESALDSFDATGLTDADIETIATLFGGEAYPTFAEAAAGAQALR